MTLIQPGLLRERVDIEEASVSQNESGDQISTWSHIATRWAGVQQRREGEYTVIMRFYRGLRPTTGNYTTHHRLRLNDEDRTILNIEDEGIIDVQHVAEMHRIFCKREPERF